MSETAGIDLLDELTLSDAVFAISRTRTRFFFIRNLPQGLVLKVPYL